MNLDNYNIFKLYNFLLKTQSYINGLSLYSSLKSFLANIIFSYVDLQIKHNTICNATIIFIRGGINNRADIDKMIDNVESTVNERKFDELLIIQNKKILPFRSIILLKRSINWYRFIHKSGYSITETLLCLAETCKMYNIYKYLTKNSIFMQYRLCVCVYDALPMENFISQYAHLNGCKTATLQHGIMLAPRKIYPLNIDFAGIEFNSFVSDYFLVWNDFTKQEAVKAGVVSDKVLVLGLAKCIGSPFINNTNNNVIGVLLDGKFEEENNEPMIKLTNEFCLRHNMKCELRYHPNFKGNEYNSMLIPGITNVCKKDVSLTEFLSNIHFCILSNTTALFEIEYYKIPYMRYSTGSIKDKYKDYISYAFNNLDNMEDCYLQMTSKMQNQSCCNEIDMDISYSRYKDFFNMF